MPVGTTEVKTIKPAGGGDYTTLNEWYAAEVGDLVAGGKIKVAEVYSGGNCLSGGCQMTGWTTDVDHYVEIRAAAGHGHEGVYDEAKAYGRSSGQNEASIETRANYTRLVGMQLKATAGNASPAWHAQNSCQGTLVDECILINSGGNTDAIKYSGGGGTAHHVIRNSIGLTPNAETVLQAVGVVGTCFVDVYNCTMIGLGGKALNAINGATITTKNNYLHATTCYAGGAYLGGEGDATSSAEAVDVALRSVAYSVTNFLNVTGGTEDLHIQDDSVLVGAGIDTSGLGVTTDVDGQARTLPYDIGADQVVVPVVTPVADFSADVTEGEDTLDVEFTDLSTDTPTSWLWDFGDGDTSISQNPTHTYVAPGTYTVELTATNDAGSDTETKVAYVLVTSSVSLLPFLLTLQGATDSPTGVRQMVVNADDETSAILIADAYFSTDSSWLTATAEQLASGVVDDWEGWTFRVTVGGGPGQPNFMAAQVTGQAGDGVADILTLLATRLSVGGFLTASYAAGTLTVSSGDTEGERSVKVGVTPPGAEIEMAPVFITSITQLGDEEDDLTVVFNLPTLIPTVVRRYDG